MKKGNNSRNELQKYIYITGYTRLCDKSVCLYEKDIKNNDNKWKIKDVCVRVWMSESESV